MGHDHKVLFYEHGQFLAAAVVDFLCAGLAAGQPVMAIATETHRNSFAQRLGAKGIDVESARRTGQLTLLDAQELLATFMVGSEPDRERFAAVVGSLIDRSLGTSGSDGVRIYGEMVDVLWAAGQADAAIQLEQLWNELAATRPFSLMCAYPLGHFYHESHAPQFEAICREHAEVIPTERYTEADEATRRVEISILQQRARALETEIEHRKALEQRLRESLVLRQYAEDAVRAGAQQLREALQAEQHSRAEAENANLAKSQFLAAMSHELRTPLNAIAGYADLLELEVRGPLTVDQREYLARIRASQQYLLSLINDVLNFAKLEAGRVDLDLRPVALDSVLRDLHILFAPQLSEKQLRYSYIPVVTDCQAHADPEKLRQIMVNLVGNAIKYTPPGGRVEVSIVAEGDAGESGPLYVRAMDTGVGIAPDQLTAIFEPFVQVGRRLSRPHEGVGLGLAISRELARRMGGDLTVESVPGKGSVFTLRLERADIRGGHSCDPGRLTLERKGASV